MNKTAPTLRSLDMPRLVVERPDGKEVHHHLSGKEVTIGRDPSNRITIPDNFISKFHAKILINETSLVLVDLQSANKTYVNDRPISEAPLRYGDRIRFAAVNCRLEAPESQAKQAAAAAPPPSPSSVPKPERPKPAPPPKAPGTPATPPSSRAPAKRPAAKKPSAAPPPVEADPMKRLLRIGGLLILVSLALAILLRVLLVPSQVEEVSDGATEASREASAGSESATPPATDTSPPPQPTTSAPVTPAAAAEDGDAEYHFDEGLAHLDTGRLREARESFERALELDPDHSRARTRLSLLEEEIESKLERHFDNARQAFQFLRYEEAIAEWEMFLQLANESDPRYPEAQQGIQQAQAKLR